LNRTCLNILSLLLLAAPPFVARGQVAQPRADSIWTVELRGVVVTATRTPRSLENVPASVRLITRAHAAEQGSLRISDMLEEFAELRVIRNQFGAGLQLRGLDPAYTLILVDGQPVTGRTGGTIDLDRLPTSFVERIEVVRGPSSSLYGSEALAGVINVITRRASGGASAQVDYQRETHGTSNLSGTSSFGRGSFSGLLSANRSRAVGGALARGRALPEEPDENSEQAACSYECLADGHCESLYGAVQIDVPSESTTNSPSVPSATRPGEEPVAPPQWTGRAAQRRGLARAGELRRAQVDIRVARPCRHPRVAP